jgi:hypothetical protein
MVKSFLCFELLWAYEGLANDPKSFIHYYGFTICHLFFGIVTVSPRKDSNGQQA